jgi:polyphosphate glucokinase
MHMNADHRLEVNLLAAAPPIPAGEEQLPPPAAPIQGGTTVISTISAVAAPIEQAPAPALEPAPAPAKKSGPSSILVVDVGGTKIKILVAGQTEARKAPSGKGFTPTKLVETVRKLAQGWEYDAVSVGYPGLAGVHGPRSEPGNLGPGWVGFDYGAAFDKPVKIVNDATMQALGSYEGGRMLFLGLGTGVGSTLIAGNVVVPLELGSLRYDGNRTLNDVLSRRGLARLGKDAWRDAVNLAVTALMRAFVADYVVMGGGNAKNVKELPPGVRRGHNLTAFRGGFRLWSLEDVFVLAAPGGETAAPAGREEMRVL